MTIDDYRAGMKSMHMPCTRKFDNNPLPSSTDPTQDVPVSQIQFGLNDVPLNVRINNKRLAYTNLFIDQMSSVDRRNNDVFDAVGELRALERANAGKKVNVKTKKSVKNEN